MRRSRLSRNDPIFAESPRLHDIHLARPEPLGATLPGPSALQGSASSGSTPAPAYARHQPEHTLLYQIVERYYPAFLAKRAPEERPLPAYVQREFEQYLKCGRLEYGFLRVRCESCHAERLRSRSEQRTFAACRSRWHPTPAFSGPPAMGRIAEARLAVRMYVLHTRLKYLARPGAIGPFCRENHASSAGAILALHSRRQGCSSNPP